MMKFMNGGDCVIIWSETKSKSSRKSSVYESRIPNVPLSGLSTLSNVRLGSIFRGIVCVDIDKNDDKKDHIFVGQNEYEIGKILRQKNQKCIGTFIPSNSDELFSFYLLDVVQNIIWDYLSDAQVLLQFASASRMGDSPKILSVIF